MTMIMVIMIMMTISNNDLEREFDRKPDLQKKLKENLSLRNRIAALKNGLRQQRLLNCEVEGMHFTLPLFFQPPVGGVEPGNVEVT